MNEKTMNKKQNLPYRYGPFMVDFQSLYLTTKDEEKTVSKGHDESQVAKEDVEVGPRDSREHVDVNGDGGGGKNFNLLKKN